MQKMECPCGYVYDPAEGDPEHNIPPGPPLFRFAGGLGLSALRGRKGVLLSGRLTSCKTSAFRCRSRRRKAVFLLLPAQREMNE